jgi:farnesyl-diphosphate farnesyltransferase
MPPRNRAAEQYCHRVLPAVSRTFALGIRVLPGELGRAVLAAYLICRIADTVEDDPALPAADKALLFDRLEGCFVDAAEPARFAEAAGALRGDPAHLDLTRHAGEVFAVFRALPPATRATVERWVGVMIRGMKQFVLAYPHGLRIQTFEEYKEYCYYVAGTVGYLLTDLWHQHSRSVGEGAYQRLRERARAFAEALQTVNILKDVAKDAEVENNIYIPEQLLREHGSSHAELLSARHEARNRRALGRLVRFAFESLEEARVYLLQLPRRALAIRAFCVLPILFAAATLRDLAASSAMLRPGGTVKISRAEVRALLVTGLLLVPSNRALGWLVSRVKARPFRLA